MRLLGSTGFVALEIRLDPRRAGEPFALARKVDAPPPGLVGRRARLRTAKQTGCNTIPAEGRNP